MERENKINHTKENPVKRVNEKLYPIDKDDRDIMRLEKTCNILSTALKVEMVITLVVATFAFIFNGSSFNATEQVKANPSSISVETNYNSKI